MEEDDHPLRQLAPFFLRPIADEGGAKLPELYEESRRTQALHDRSERLLSERALSRMPLETRVLERYFGAWVDEGSLPPPVRGPSARPIRRNGEPNPVVPDLARLLPEVERTARMRLDDESVQVRCVKLSPLSGAESIVAELTSWPSGSACGLFHAHFEFQRVGRPTHSVECVVKSKASDRRVIEVGEAVASLCALDLAEAYTGFREDLGFTLGHRREVALYLASRDGLRRHAPLLLRCCGGRRPRRMADRARASLGPRPDQRLGRSRPMESGAH